MVLFAQLAELFRQGAQLWILGPARVDGLAPGGVGQGADVPCLDAGPMGVKLRRQLIVPDTQTSEWQGRRALVGPLPATVGEIEESLPRGDVGDQVQGVVVIGELGARLLYFAKGLL